MKGEVPTLTSVRAKAERQRKAKEKHKAKVLAERKRKLEAKGDFETIPHWPAGAKWIAERAHKPTEDSRKLVEMMTAYGATLDQIAEVMNVSRVTVWRHYREETLRGGHRANMLVAHNLFKIATNPRGGNSTVQAAIWWSKARMGWSEIRRVAANVQTIQTNARDLSDDQLLEIVARGGPGGDLPPPDEPGESQ